MGSALFQVVGVHSAHLQLHRPFLVGPEASGPQNPSELEERSPSGLGTVSDVEVHACFLSVHMGAQTVRAWETG